MASKLIFDSPDLLDESLVPLTAACKCFPVKCSRPALERWARRGSRGTVLETVLLCGKRYTSQEAINRFCRNQLQVEPVKATPRRGSMSAKDIETASRRFGLPVPMSHGAALATRQTNKERNSNHD